MQDLPFSGFPRPRDAIRAAFLVASVGLAGCDSSDSNQPLSPDPSATALSQTAAAKATVRVFATGLRFPRGMTFGGGNVYVAEAGSGGTNRTTPRQCEQVVPPVGPYTNGRTARISRIGPNGNRSTFAFNFPSAAAAIGDVDGVGDVAFVGNQLYALVSGGGCSHGVRGVAAGLYRVSSGADWSLVADLSAFQRAHPVAHPEPGDFEPDGTWFSMRVINGIVFAVEPNHGEVVRIDPATGAIRRIADVSAKLGHVVPTALAERNGNLFFGNLGTFPVTPGNEKVWSLARNGDISVAKGGFTTVLGLDFDSRGPDGKLYISNKGFGPPQPGELLQVDVP
jgi:hypothetical protein